VLVNIEGSTASSPTTSAPPHTPFSGRRPLLFERFADNSAYAVNREHPSGVFYLRPSAADRLEDVLRTHGNPPQPSVIPDISRSPAEQVLFRKLLTPEAREASSAQSTKRLNVWFHISNSCNLACSYCYIPHLRKALTIAAEGSVTTQEQLKRGIQNLFALCVARGFTGLHLRFAGGEPLLALDEMEATCQIATRESERSGVDLTFAVLTNGTLVSDRFLALLDRFNFRGISISIDGTSAFHDKYRFRTFRGTQEKQGTWELIFQNIRVLKQNGHSPYILTTLTEANYSTIDEFVETCLDSRLGFRLSPVRDTRTAGVPGLQDAIVRKLHPIYAALPQRLPITRPIQDYANFAEWSPGVKKSTACGTCRTSFAVGQHGDVSTCQMRLEKSYGSIAAESAVDAFDRMVSDPSNWRFMNPRNMTGGCTQCLWRYSCSGGCPEHTQMVYHTYDSPSAWCKLYGDFLPIYFRAIATQIKIEADRLAARSPSTA